jgi:predicted RNA-binding protein with RPS1 domain
MFITLFIILLGLPMKHFFISWGFRTFVLIINNIKKSQMATVKKRNSRWTQEDDDLLIALVNKGQCSKEIAKVLGRTRAAIWTRKHNLAMEDPKLNGVRIKPATGDLREARTPSGTTVHVAVPFSATLDIPANLIPGFIGSKGSHISGLQEQLGVKMRIQEDNSLLIRGNSPEEVERAEAYVRELIREPEIGATYTGKVNTIVKYGAFISLNPLYQGLCHASEVIGQPIDNIEDHLSVGQEVRVKVMTKVNGKYALSISAAQPVPEITTVQTLETDPEIMQVLTPREITQEMTKLARQLARANGQRMVMAVYYVEGNQD